MGVVFLSLERLYRNNSSFTKIIDLNSSDRLNFKIHSKMLYVK